MANGDEEREGASAEIEELRSKLEKMEGELADANKKASEGFASRDDLAQMQARLDMTQRTLTDPELLAAMAGGTTSQAGAEPDLDAMSQKELAKYLEDQIVQGIQPTVAGLQGAVQKLALDFDVQRCVMSHDELKAGHPERERYFTSMRTIAQGNPSLNAEQAFQQAQAQFLVEEKANTEKAATEALEKEKSAKSANEERGVTMRPTGAAATKGKSPQTLEDVIKEGMKDLGLDKRTDSSES